MLLYYFKTEAARAPVIAKKNNSMFFLQDNSAESYSRACLKKQKQYANFI